MDKFSFRIGWRHHVAGPMRVRDYIALLLAAQEVARAGSCAPAIYKAYEALATAVAGMTRPRPDLSNVPLRRLYLLALVLREQLLPEKAARPPSGDAKRIAALQAPRNCSREELLVPVLRTAMLTRIPVAELLETPVGEFDSLLAAGEAAWARIKLELVDVISIPHLKSEHIGERLMELRRPLDDIRPPDWNPWRKHAAETAARLGMLS